MGSKLKPQFVLFKVEENVRPNGIFEKALSALRGETGTHIVTDGHT